MQQFEVTEKRKKFIVAGMRVTKGEIIKAERVKLIRDETVLYDGKWKLFSFFDQLCASLLCLNLKLTVFCNFIFIFNLAGPIASLRHLKNEVNSIKSGSECGLMLGDASIPVKLGDVIICYKTKEVRKTLDWDPGF